MKALLKKELFSFFTSPAAYSLIAVFTVVNGLFFWVFKTDYNIFERGFADLSAFFEWMPWMYMFFIPALTMRSFSEEFRTGTWDLLLAKPLSYMQLIGGKFIAAYGLILMALLPSMLYLFTLSNLLMQGSVIDYGAMAASYAGLLFLAGAYVAMGIFASSLTRHQVVAFILAGMLCFFMYYGWEGMATLSFFRSVSSSLPEMGIKDHINSMQKGVIAVADIVYCLSVPFFFLYLTRLHLLFRNSR